MFSIIAEASAQNSASMNDLDTPMLLLSYGKDAQSTSVYIKI